MKIKKYKYLGPVDTIILDHYLKPTCYGLPVIIRHDFSKNGAEHLKYQSSFIEDKEVNTYSDVSCFKYIERI